MDINIAVLIGLGVVVLAVVAGVVVYLTSVKEHSKGD
jgi:hypothetical protein